MGKKAFVFLEKINNFPPLPRWCPCKPCFYHNISVEIPPHNKSKVKMMWLLYWRTKYFSQKRVRESLFLCSTSRNLASEYDSCSSCIDWDRRPKRFRRSIWSFSPISCTLCAMRFPLLVLASIQGFQVLTHIMGI